MAYPKTAWVLTDGKAGDELQCLGVAEALNIKPDIRRIAPKHPYDWLAPWGPVDPAEYPDQPDSPLRGPYPDLVIASGRRAIPALRFIKTLLGDRVFTVCLKDPRTGPNTADLIWVPEHDRLAGPNVIRTLTSPHRLRLTDLQAARIEPPRALLALPHPRVGVLVGGNSRNHIFTDEDIARFVAGLEKLTQQGAALIATLSRRSPKALADAVQGCIAVSGGYLWDGKGVNPYHAILALSDQFVVTADSVNMISEACITGRPIQVFEPSRRFFGNAAKINRFISGLIAAGAVQNFQGTLESYAYKPLDSTPVIAEAIKLAFANRSSALL